jgi:hypothetical protein
MCAPQSLLSDALRTIQFDIGAADNRLFAAVVGLSVILLLAGHVCASDRLQDLIELLRGLLLGGYRA